MKTYLSRGELANRGFRVGACLGATLGFSLCMIWAVLSFYPLDTAVHSDDMDDVSGPVALLVFCFYVMLFPLGTALCVACTVVSAMLCGAAGILLTKLLFRRKSARHPTRRVPAG